MINNALLSDKEVQIELKNILHDFANYCDENGLKYYLYAGTLLGAVRHKGFIPWDDDIDVYMTRDDYNKLHKVFKMNPMQAKYKLESLQQGNSYFPFAKIVNTELKIVNSRVSLHDYLWIDIFPIDGVHTTDKKILDKNKKKISRWGFLLVNACCEIGSGKTFLKSLVKMFVILYARIRGARYYADKIENFAKKNRLQDCKQGANVVWGDANIPIKESYILEECKLEFEGEMFTAPKEWDKQLKIKYGDYMKLPPEKDRVSHGLKIQRIKKV